jgi:hypothetical protein
MRETRISSSLPTGSRASSLVCRTCWWRIISVRDSTRSQVWLPQSQTRINLVPSRDRNRLQNHSGHVALGRPFSPAQGLRALAHGQAHGGPIQNDRGYGSDRENRSRSHSVGVGDRPWVILPASCRQISDKSFGMMVARDGVEPPTPAFSADIISDFKYLEVPPGAVSHPMREDVKKKIFPLPSGETWMW